jgi:hypothetical protein
MKYRTLDGEVLTIPEDDRPLVELCYNGFRLREDSEVITDRIRARWPWIDRKVSANPAYQAARDLRDRLAVLEGSIGAEPGDDPVSDPWVA